MTATTTTAEPLSPRSTAERGRPSPAQRISQIQFRDRQERQELADHLHSKWKEVNDAVVQLQQGRKELEENTQSPLPPKARLSLIIMNRVDELKRDEYKGVFGWKGEAAKNLNTDLPAYNDALADAQLMQLRIQAYEEEVLRPLRADDVHQAGDKGEMEEEKQQEPTPITSAVKRTFEKLKEVTSAVV